MLTVFERKALSCAYAAALLAGLGAQSANAAVFAWSFTDAAAGIDGAGTLTASQDPVNSNIFYLTAITGKVNGIEILGLSLYNGPDQNIFYPDPPNTVVDTLGFSFSVGDGKTSYNIYRDAGTFAPGDYYACGATYCLLGPGATNGDNFDVGPGSDPFTPLDTLTLSEESAVPEPSTWAMLLLGFAGLAFAGYRSSRRGFRPFA